MPKTLRDMYSELIRAVNFDDQKAEKIQVFGILHLGLWIQFTRLWRAGGSICIFCKDFPSHNVDSTFSEDGIRPCFILKRTKKQIIPGLPTP